MVGKGVVIGNRALLLGGLRSTQNENLMQVSGPTTATSSLYDVSCESLNVVREI